MAGGSFDEIAIFSGNSNPWLVDEICDYIGIVRGRADVFKFSNDNTFVRIGESVRELVAEQYRVFNEQVMPALEREGIVVVNHASRTAAERRWVAKVFETTVRPLLVPVGLDPAHPFPQVANKSLNFIARLTGKDAFGRRNAIAIVKVPRVLPRVMALPRTGFAGGFLASSE